jgi:hypothetical protein
MQQKIWKWVCLISILIVIVKVVIPSIWSEAKATTQTETNPIDPQIAEYILQTSIQITMVEQVMEKSENQESVSDQEEIWQIVEKSTKGLGTLVNYQGEVLLISHDHWSLFTSSTAPDKVIFRDYKGSLLLEMSGADLLTLILYHDSGTFILKAPYELTTNVMATADMELFETPKPGDIVHVVHHPDGQANQISILTAEIVDQELFNGVPMLSLRNLNGHSIEPGDSGGGIWINGRLAGNMWMTVREVRQYWWQLESPDHNETAFSLAAGLPDDLIDLVETLLQVQSPPSLESDGLS